MVHEIASCARPRSVANGTVRHNAGSLSRSQPLRDDGSGRDYVLPALSIESLHFVRSTSGLLLRPYTTIPDSALRSYLH